MTRNRRHSRYDGIEFKKPDDWFLQDMEEEEEEAKAKAAARESARAARAAALAAAPALLISQINAITTKDEYKDFVEGKGFTTTGIFSDNSNELNITLFRNKTYEIFELNDTLSCFLNAKETKFAEFTDEFEAVSGLKYLQEVMDKFLFIRGSLLPPVTGVNAGERLYNRIEYCAASLYEEIIIPFYMQIKTKYKAIPGKDNMSYIFGRFKKHINYYLDIFETCKGTLTNLVNINNEAIGKKIVKRINYILEDMNGTTIATNLTSLKTDINVKFNAVDTDLKFAIDTDTTMDGRRRSRRKSRRSKRSSKKRSDGKKKKSKSRRSKRSSKKRSSKRRSADGKRKSRRTRRKSRRSKKRSTRRRY